MEETEKITEVLLVDDHSLYREGLAALFERWNDFEVVGEALDGLEAVEFCRKHTPQIVLMDLRMPNMDGVDATRIITAENPAIAVVILSIYMEEKDVIAAIQNGARGYLVKNIHANQLHSQLKSVAAGHSVLSSEVCEICFDLIKQSPILGSRTELDPGIGALTDHERQLIRLVAMGYSNRDIGERMHIGEGTVKKQISIMLTKLGLENRVQAAVYALRSGIAG